MKKNVLIGLQRVNAEKIINKTCVECANKLVKFHNSVQKENISPQRTCNDKHA